MRKNILISLCVLLNACVYYPSPAANRIIESSEREVSQCRLLGQVYGDSGNLLLSSVGVQVAKDQAKDRASALGATHVFWTEQNVRINPYFVGKAYRCAFK
jgi:hypothetical protein